MDRAVAKKAPISKGAAASARLVLGGCKVRMRAAPARRAVGHAGIALIEIDSGRRALERTGGPLTKAERTWADGVLSKARSKRRQTRKRAA